MNVRTLVIALLAILVILYLLNKKWIRIESVCFDDDNVSGLTVRKGIYSITRVKLKIGESKQGYSLIKNASKTILTLPGGKTKTFESLPYYEKNGLNPAE